MEVKERLEAQAVQMFAELNAHSGISRWNSARSIACATEGPGPGSPNGKRPASGSFVLNGPAESVETVPPYRALNRVNVLSMELPQLTVNNRGNRQVERAVSPGILKAEDITREVAEMLDQLDQASGGIVLNATPRPTRPSSAHRKVLEALQRSTEVQLLLASKKQQKQQTKKKSMREILFHLETQNKELQARNASLEAQCRQSELLGVALLTSSLELSTIQERSVQSVNSKNAALRVNLQQLQMEVETLQRRCVDFSVGSIIGSIFLSSSAEEFSSLIHRNEELNATNRDLTKCLGSLSERTFVAVPHVVLIVRVDPAYSQSDALTEPHCV